jgi:hypothetical protein
MLLLAGAAGGALGELGARDAQVPADELADEAGAVVAGGLRGDVETVPQVLFEPDAPVLGDLPGRLVRHGRGLYFLYVQCGDIHSCSVRPLYVQWKQDAGTRYGVPDAPNNSYVTSAKTHSTAGRAAVCAARKRDA